MSKSSNHSFRSDDLTVTVTAEGAELVSLRAAGQKLLWQAGPEWKRHAPVLFPIVGRLRDDRLTVDGRAYPMGQHGFARDRRFDWVDRRADGCHLILRSDADTLAHYPFPFTLEIDYRLEGPRLFVEYTIGNSGKTVLPASIGAHPAFRWPLEDGVDPSRYRLVFEQDEPAPIRRVEGGLLSPSPRPTPIRDRVLALGPSLFADDAVILDRLNSSHVRFEAPGALRALEVGWHDMTALGIWSKPGAAFLCIEPWRGHASPADFDGPFAEKPGLLHIEPGAAFNAGWSVKIT